VRGECVARHDNEAGKGDHRHDGGVESIRVFSGLDALEADFWADVAAWKE